MTIEEKIEKALFDRAALLVDADVVPADAIAWPNDKFPAEGVAKPGTYIEILHFPNTPTRRAMKGSNAHFRQGILQITVFVPLLSGKDDATRLGGEVAAHFPADLMLFEDGARIDVQAAPHLAGAAKSDDETSWAAIVSVSYRCLA